MIFNKTSLLFLMLLQLSGAYSLAQNPAYKDSIVAYQQQYISTHEVVGAADRKYLHFYEPDISYKIRGQF
ncbi:MAG: hypothetical protein ABIR19_04690, partial [Ginsengibacter sp.]